MENDGENIPNEEVPVKLAGRAILNAAWFRRLKLTKLLVVGGDEVNAQNEDGQTALVLTILSTHTDTVAASKEHMVKYLLDQGADPNLKDKFGQIALIHACKEKCSYEVIKLLLDSGSIPTLEDRFGRNALHIAAQNCDSNILNLMARHCKTIGKEVIIITQKDPPVSSHSAQPAFVQDKLQTDALPQPTRHQSPAATLTVPSETINTGQAHDSGGHKCIFGSPRPRTRFHHEKNNSRPTDNKEGNQSLSLSVNTIPEMNDTWIPRSPPQYSTLSDCPSDLHKMTHTEKKSATPKKWAETGELKHQAHQNKILKRRATTMGFSSSSLIELLPLPNPVTGEKQEENASHPMTDLRSVKSQLLQWEKELSKTHTCSSNSKVGSLRFGSPASQEEHRGLTETSSCEEDLQKTSISGVILPSLCQSRGIQFNTQGSYSRDSAIFSGEDADESAEISDLQPPLRSKENKYNRARLVGPGGKVLERKGSATKLLDHLSYTRPGTLPPLNVNLSKPVPGIDASPHVSISQELDTLGDTDGPPDAEGLTPRQRLASLNPKRCFFNQRSQTIHMGDMHRLMTLNDRCVSTTHTGHQE